ncbi:MAG TPA: MFS transporter [Acidimicrobiales bacterium]|nr:MFS transporter [Acidimicrobiales bacterium]
MTDTAGRPDVETSLGATLRALALPIYLPWFTAVFGVGVLVPVLPLYLRDQGASFTLVSVVLAASGVGATIGALPSGSIAGRFGERALLVVSLVVLAASTALLGVTGAAVALVALRLAEGAGSVGVTIAQQTRITRHVPARVRGRSMSLAGGTFRLAMLIGPVTGGVVADRAGFTAAFALAGAVTAAGALPVLFGPRLAGEERREGDPVEAPSGLLDALRRHRRLLLRVGVGPALVLAVRSGRMVVVPLTAAALDLGPAAVGAIVAAGTAADLLLFPISGHLMDRRGRLWAMVPSFTLLAVGLVVLAAATTPALVVVAGVVMGIGNGLGSGTMLTLGSDVAPADAPGPFLAALGAFHDLGRIIGPLVVGVLADAVGLRFSSLALAGVMVLGIVWIVVVIGETVDRAPSRP